LQRHKHQAQGTELNDKTTVTRYSDPLPTSHRPKWLVVEHGCDKGASFTFYDRLEIGRYQEGRRSAGLLQINDPTVSGSHCVITQESNGRCFVRDKSRNGTRVNGRRLSPNLKTELKVGQVLSIGKLLRFRLEGEEPSGTASGLGIPTQTLGNADTSMVTVLVGDIRNYTTLVQRADPVALQESVSRVFKILEQTVVKLGGTIKEYQGDALFAFWEEGSARNHAVQACRAALELHQLATECADDGTIWSVDGFPLRIDWALASGPVTISGYGGDNALGLSMVGESVVLAFRIEKFADDATGSIIACPVTQMMCADSFEFRDLGKKKSKGFETSHRLYALVGERG
jgi:class 3 adenylate cyclase